MKIFNLLTLFAALLMLPSVSFAQVPGVMNYQAVARDGMGVILANTGLVVKIKIVSGNITGPNEFEETHLVSTNNLGMFTLAIGSGNYVGGNHTSLSNINWAGNTHYMNVQVNLGTGYVDLGTHQLLSVPYAMYAQRATIADSVVNFQTAVPAGGIIMWSGSLVNIPSGWVLCDGTNGTPDLRDRFIMGAGGSHPVGSTGGSASHDHSIPSLSVTGTAHAQTDGNQHTRYAAANGCCGHWVTRDFHDHNVTGTTGGSTTGASNILPPYYSLAYIMKL